MFIIEQGTNRQNFGTYLQPFGHLLVSRISFFMLEKISSLTRLIHEL